MRKVTINQGDTIRSLAQKYKLPVEKIWGASENKQLCDKRYGDPDLLLPGDKLVVPDVEKRTESAPTEQRHRFRYLLPKRDFYLEIVNGDGALLTEHTYKLIAGDLVLDGPCTEPIDIELPAGPEAGELTVYDSNGIEVEKLQLNFDHLNPYDQDENDTSAVQGRLNNLGYFAGEVDGKLGPLTRDAVKRFQIDNDEETTGEPGDVVELIERRYGS